VKLTVFPYLDSHTQYSKTMHFKRQ